MDVPELQQQIFPLLRPFSALYGLAMQVRRKQPPGFRPPCACVSVGNIAWGGSGKTPLVEWLMHWAAGRNVKAVTLSRGYRAHLQNPPVEVSLRHTARDVGDEPLMLVLSCPRIPVVVDPERRRAAQFALSRLRPELIFMDDGFQHLDMARDLDLVLLRPEDLKDQWDRVIPAGSWREPSSALQYAGAFLIKCPPDAAEALMPLAAERLERFGKPVFTFSLSPLNLRQVDGEGVVTPAEVNSRPYMLVTGVGEPEQVKATVTAYMGYAPEEVVIHEDHYRYTFREVESMAANRKMVICTAKDAAKMRLFPCANVWYLRTDLRFGPALWTDQTFPDWWTAWWQNWKPSSRKR